MNAVILFIICTAINVILSTIKSIATIKGGKFMAALMNALTYGFYSWVIILTTIDNLSTVDKMLITAACNFIGVYLVKFIEEKTRKEQLWKIEATVPFEEMHSLTDESKEQKLVFNYTPIGKYTIFNFYSYSRRESEEVAELLQRHDAKYFVSEAKTMNL